MDTKPRLSTTMRNIAQGRYKTNKLICTKKKLHQWAIGCYIKRALMFQKLKCNQITMTHEIPKHKNAPKR
jgi:hypothetical protein